jgi:hypothetical protein
MVIADGTFEEIIERFVQLQVQLRTAHIGIIGIFHQLSLD